MYTQLVATIATVLTGTFLFPQIARLIRHGDTAGVSVTWAAFGLVTNLAWLAYLALLELWIAAAAPGLAVITYATVLRLLLPTGRPAWLIQAGLYSACLLIAWAWSTEALGLALAVTPAIQLVPQILVVFNERRPIGLSPSTWALGVLEAVLWATYGSMIGDRALVGYGVITALGAALVLGCWWLQWGRHAMSPALDPSGRYGVIPSTPVPATASILSTAHRSPTMPGGPGATPALSALPAGRGGHN